MVIRHTTGRGRRAIIRCLLKFSAAFHTRREIIRFLRSSLGRGGSLVRGIRMLFQFCYYSCRRIANPPSRPRDRTALSKTVMVLALANRTTRRGRETRASDAAIQASDECQLPSSCPPSAAPTSSIRGTNSTCQEPTSTPSSHRMAIGPRTTAPTGTSSGRC